MMEHPPYQAPIQQPYQNNRLQTDIVPAISTGGWLGTLLLLMIPLVNLILLIVWAASGTENPNRRNFARAYLVFMVIGIALAIVISIGFGAGAASLTDYLENL